MLQVLVLWWWFGHDLFLEVPGAIGDDEDDPNYSASCGRDDFKRKLLVL